MDERSMTPRARQLFERSLAAITHRTDRMFAGLIAFQWALGIAMALWLSPRTWAGPISSVHAHVYAAVLLGGVLASLPIALALLRPGAAATRHVVAVSQMLFSALLIHLTGGRIETHFHVFGSMAFLAFYRDWRVLATATAVIALDHGLRGVFWPVSVYGVSSIQPWRFVEHTGWVLFENVFLVRALISGLRDMRQAAAREAELEEAKADIERKVVERTEELARSNAALEQFAYAASHDLQEPLRKVATFTQLLEQRYRGRLDEQADHFIGRAVEGARHMSELISSLLLFSRVGNADSRLERVDSGMIVERVKDSLELRIKETGAEVTHDRLPLVHAAPLQLAQIFQNLIGNALKFRGTETPKVHVGVQRVPEGWLFRVRDNGIGIEPRHASQLFVIFRRLHTRSEYPGTGIGLAVCKKIVERHGGRIWVESEAGRGSTFCFTMPAAPAPSAISVPPAGRRRRTVAA